MQTASRFHTIATTRPFRETTESVTMATMKFPARRMILAGGFAVAVAAAPAIASVAMPSPAATPLAQCPGGEEEDLYTSLCVPHLVPNAGATYTSIAGNPDLAAVNLPAAADRFPAPVITPDSASACQKNSRRRW